MELGVEGVDLKESLGSSPSPGFLSAVFLQYVFNPHKTLRGRQPHFYILQRTKVEFQRG